MAIDLTFPERAVKSFIIAAKSRRISPRHVNDILKYEHVDVTDVVPFLNDTDDWIRRAAVKIIGRKGDKSLLVGMINTETNRTIIIDICNELMKSKDDFINLVSYLDSEDIIIKETVITLFKKAKRTDCLMSLLFDKDEALVERIRNYMKEEENAK
jgi:hypothetical protein